MTGFPTPAEVAREALVVLEATAASLYRTGLGARLVMPHLYQGGVHNPAVQRAVTIAGIPEDQFFDVSRQVGRKELMNWVGHERLLPREAARGMLELHDDSLYDPIGVIDAESVTAAAEHVKLFGKTLSKATEKPFFSFPFHLSSRRYMSDDFKQNWTVPPGRSMR